MSYRMKVAVIFLVCASFQTAPAWAQNSGTSCNRLFTDEELEMDFSYDFDLKPSITDDMVLELDPETDPDVEIISEQALKDSEDLSSKNHTSPPPVPNPLELTIDAITSNVEGKRIDGMTKFDELVKNEKYTTKKITQIIGTTRKNRLLDRLFDLETDGGFVSRADASIYLLKQMTIKKPQDLHTMLDAVMHLLTEISELEPEMFFRKPYLDTMRSLTQLIAQYSGDPEDPPAVSSIARLLKHGLDITHEDVKNEVAFKKNTNKKLYLTSGLALTEALKLQSHQVIHNILVELASRPDLIEQVAPLLETK